jgi:hypothetical protein
MEEKRKSKRTPVRDSFQLFLVIPEATGFVRLYLRDLSAGGLCFRTEMPMELEMGQEVEARIYLNPSFYFSLPSSTVRVQKGEYALAFNDPKSLAAQAIQHLQEFLNAAEKAAVLVD